MRSPLCDWAYASPTSAIPPPDVMLLSDDNPNVSLYTLHQREGGETHGNSVTNK
jgi:hypothetical protein